MKIGIKLMALGIVSFLTLSLGTIYPADARGPVIAEIPPAEEIVSGDIAEVIKDTEGDRLFVRVTPPARTRAGETTRSTRTTRDGRSSGDTSGTWVALPMQSMRVGQTVTFKKGVVMEGYEVKGLKRTFTKIVFTPGKQ